MKLPKGLVYQVVGLVAIAAPFAVAYLAAKPIHYLLSYSINRAYSEGYTRANEDWKRSFTDMNLRCANGSSIPRDNSVELQ